MKRLYRIEERKMIAGICAGLGEIYGIDPTIIRLAVVFLTVITGFFPVIAVYLVGWIIIPEKRDIPQEPESGTKL